MLDVPHVVSVCVWGGGSRCFVTLNQGTSTTSSAHIACIVLTWAKFSIRWQFFALLVLQQAPLCAPQPVIWVAWLEKEDGAHINIQHMLFD